MRVNGVDIDGQKGIVWYQKNFIFLLKNKYEKTLMIHHMGSDLAYIDKCDIVPSMVMKMMMKTPKNISKI